MWIQRARWALVPNHAALYIRDVEPISRHHTEVTLREVEAAARSIGVQIQVLKANTAREIEQVFDQRLGILLEPRRSPGCQHPERQQRPVGKTARSFDGALREHQVALKLMGALTLSPLPRRRQLHRALVTEVADC
jgi:hypothetical protein